MDTRMGLSAGVGAKSGSAGVAVQLWAGSDCVLVDRCVRFQKTF